MSTGNIAEMVGWALAGARMRFESGEALSDQDRADLVDANRKALEDLGLAHQRATGQGEQSRIVRARGALPVPSRRA